MILAGIDEAGYGPLLGPLVVGCCAFAVEEAEAAELPCLWQRLRRVVSKSRDRKGIRLHINDSKLVYSPAGGLKELERSILALAGACGRGAEDLGGFLRAVAGEVEGELGDYPWYVPGSVERFPLEQESASIRLLANGLRTEMDRCRTPCTHLAARIIPERRFNAIVERTRNKSSLLFSEVAGHLDYLLRNFADQGLVIFCDRQGGREHYGRLLRLMFEEWSLEVVEESEGHSEYRLERGGRGVRLIFREKAETQCMAVALASMLSKYLREALMHRFNAYWQALVPGLAPTAGYYTDGMRFLQDIAQKRGELGIGDEAMIRTR